MGGLFNIIKKEIKEMVRDPRLLLGMIIMPLLIFPVMGATMSATVESVEESASNINIALINQDVGNRSAGLIDIFDDNGVTIHNYSEYQPEVLFTQEDREYSVIVVIPPDFTFNIENDSSVVVSFYTVMETYSISEEIPSAVLASHLREYKQMIVDERLAEAFPDKEPWMVENPVIISNQAVVDGEIAENVSPGRIAEQMMLQSMMMPMVMMMLLIMASQLAATSVAMEKEEKTLETLLTMPVSRNAILFGKVGGVVAVSAIAVVAYMIGLSYYMSSVASMSGDAGLNLAEIGLVPSTTGMIILLITLFLSLIAALSVAVLLGSLTEDVRSAQALMGILYVPIFIPAIVLMFGDISQLPSVIQTIVFAIPFSYPILASKAMYTGLYTPILFGIVYQVIFTAVMIILAGKLFSTEKILTMRINLKKGKKGGAFPIINYLANRRRKSP